MHCRHFDGARFGRVFKHPILCGVVASLIVRKEQALLRVGLAEEICVILEPVPGISQSKNGKEGKNVASGSWSV